MLHPSYTDLMKVVNSGVEEGEQPVVNSRYSIVLATSKRARQIIDGANPLVEKADDKPLSIAVAELGCGQVKILGDAETEENEAQEESVNEITDDAQNNEESEETEALMEDAQAVEAGNGEGESAEAQDGESEL